MPLWIRLLIAGALSIDLIAVSKAIITGLAISPAVSSLGATIWRVASLAEIRASASAAVWRLRPAVTIKPRPAIRGSDRPCGGVPGRRHNIARTYTEGRRRTEPL
jgi:hypothetical protein